jgi:hypothetical protein
MLRTIAAVVLTLLAASCQSNSLSKTERVRIYARHSFAAADANCRMLALTRQEALYARGTPDYVAGARRSNVVRMERYYVRCMTNSGWESISYRGPRRPSQS